MRLHVKFLYVFLSSIAVILFNNGAQASHEVHTELKSSTAVTVRRVHRTGYHFQPLKNWINVFFFYIKRMLDN
ncbi:hypothetical protein ACS0TY_016358 [Phlomoides rotata]